MKPLRSLPFWRMFVLFLILSLFFGLRPATGFQDLGDYEHNRARLLGYVLTHDLETLHFSHKKIDEALSRAAFGLYLKNLDGQKRFLLAEDIEKLNVDAGMINHELNARRIEMPDKAAKILAVRVPQLRQIVREILSEDFDFSKEESIETDTEKLGYCSTLDELRERWRKMLKLQVLNRYLMTENETASADADKPGKTSPENLQDSARKKIAKSYEELFTRMSEDKERERFDPYFDAIARAFDPHTNYMPPDNKDDFDISMRGSLEGIGATLQEDDGYIKVVSVVQGGPAFRQGLLRAGDHILKVGEGDNDPVDITDMRVKEAVKLIRGKKGTEVKLTVRKPEGQVVIPIVRDVVQIEETFAKGITLKDEKSGKTFGYIKIPSFYRDFEKTRSGGKGRNCTDDVKTELKKIVSQNVSGIILDLRNNGGGALTDAVKMAGLFIKTGPVVQVKNSNDKIEILSDDDPDINYSGPLAVLVNKFSASASEILAGALQDYGRAVIIGAEHTHGKGTVQSIVDLNGDIPFENMDKYKTLGALRITVQKFYRITGESTQYKGVVPDIILPDRFDSIKSGEEFLTFSLPWDTVSPVQYTKWAAFNIDVPALRARSNKRVMSNKDFADIIAGSKKISDLEKKTVRPLNIEAARKDFAEAQSRKETAGKGFHGEMEQEKKASALLSEEEKSDLLAKEAGKDVYVQETISVLNDAISLNSDLSPNRVQRRALIPSLADRIIPAWNPLF